MDTSRVLRIAEEHLLMLSGHVFDLLTLSRPVSPEAALNLSRVVSKLSPLVGNLIEFNTVEFLNGQKEFQKHGRWIRQDPGFPDTVFEGKIEPTPGFEIKAWFPLATEITARFKDSQNHFKDDQTGVCMLAWLPQHLIFGKPYILDVVVVSGSSFAKARDNHYHNPPDYLVLEPEDTKERTRNLQQTNTNGYKFQGTPADFKAAQKIVAKWRKGGATYKPTETYQKQLRQLTARFKYRLDTNYAKMDRIVHPGIEAFKKKVYGTQVNGMSVQDWCRLFAAGNDKQVRASLRKHLGIKAESAEKLLG